MNTPVPNRSGSPFPARHSNGGVADRAEGDLWGGGGGGGGREGSPLFRKANNNNAQPSRSNTERAGLQAMRQFAADVNRGAGSSPPPNPAYTVARPKTTGSVNQSVAGGRRQSMGSIRSAHNNNSSRAPPNGQRQQQQQQQQQQRPRLTRNLTLGDLRWTATAAAAAMGGGLPGAGVDNGGNGGIMARRGWQVGTTRGGSSSSGISGSNLRQLVVGDASSGRSRQGSAELPTGEGLSRLPLLESSSPDKLRQHQEEQRQLQLQGNIHVSVENSDLSEHGLSFGLSALKGRRPYMEDESKVLHLIEST